MGVRSVNNQSLDGLVKAVAHAPNLEPRAGGDAAKTASPPAQAANAAGKKLATEATGSTQEPASQRSGTKLHVDKATKRVVAQVLDANNQVVKQIPPEEQLKIAAKLRELQQRVFDLKA